MSKTRITEPDTRIPSEQIADMIAADPAAQVWLCIEPHYGRETQWETLRAITDRMRQRVRRRDVTDDLVDHLNDELERNLVVSVHASRPRPTWGGEVNSI